MFTLVTRASVWTVRFGPDMAGCRYAVAAEQRWPFRWVSWYQPTPSWRGPLKSLLAAPPCSRAAAVTARRGGVLSGGWVPAGGPPMPWYGPAPRELSSALLKYGMRSS